MAADEPISDDEWRNSKFTEDELLSARRMGAVPFKDLKKHLERFGPDGILESAIMLPRTQYEKLEELVKKSPKGSHGKYRKRRS